MKTIRSAVLSVAQTACLCLLPVITAAQPAKVAPATGDTIMTCHTQAGRNVSVAYSPAKQALVLKVSGGPTQPALAISSKLEAIYLNDSLFFADIYSFESAGVKYRLVDADADDGSLSPLFSMRGKDGPWVEDICAEMNKNEDFKLPSTFPAAFKDMESFVKKYGEAWRH